MTIKTAEEKQADRVHAIEQARWILGGDYFILDTETTGLKNAQMCQIAILYSDGTEFSSLVKPTIPIEPGAEAVHHITNADVSNAPMAGEISAYLQQDLPIVIYNAKFDMEILANSLLAAGARQVTFPEVYDVMLIYAAFHGEWSDYHGNYKWQKLGVACEQCGIPPIEGAYHDALYDVKMTHRLLTFIANQELDIK